MFSSDRFWKLAIPTLLALAVVTAAVLWLVGQARQTVTLGTSHMSGPLDITEGGSASAPALYFAGDSDTGLYRSAANNLDFAAGGSRIANVSSSGLDLVAGNLSSTTGAVTITDSVNITGTVDADSTLNVDGATTLNSTLDVDGNISSGTGSITMTDSLLVTDTLTVNQAGASDIADFQDSGTTTVKVPDGGGLLLNPAGSPTGSEGLLNYDNAKSGFEALEVYDGNHWRPVDPRRDLRDQTFTVISGTTSYASEFSWIPVFTHPDLGISMGGFWMAKYEMSQPGATRSNGDTDVADNADPGTVPAISQPGVAPWDNINFAEARKAVQNAGREYHLCTAEEWAAAAYWAQLAGTMPYGNNNNSSTAPGDTDIDAYDCVEGGVTDKLCGTGSGPNAFSLSYWGSGPMDLNGNMWEWVDGLYMDTSGYVYVFSDTLHINTQVGTTTANSGTTITDTNQAWSANQWAGYYLQTGTGTAVQISSNGATTITVASGTPSGDYSIVRRIDTDVTSAAGTSGQNTLTLWNDEGDAAADLALPRLAIPRTSDATGSTTYGKDGFWYNKSAFRAAIRGGTWSDGVGSGVFALNLGTAPSTVNTPIGFRACKAP